MEWQPDSTQNFTYSRLQAVKLKLLPKITPQEDGVSLYQSISLAGHLQHTYGGHSLCSAPWCPAFSLLCAASWGVLCTAFLYPAVLQLTLVWAGICHRWAFIHTGCLHWEVLALIPSLQLGAVFALPEGTFCSVCQVGDEEAKQYWLQCWPWEMLLIVYLPVKLQVFELSLNLTMTRSQFSSPFLDLLLNC